MAIQIGGTTVIDDSRDLQNVGGLKTVGGASILGSGDISVGGSTTYGAVGTYTMAYGALGGGYSAGDTISGSSLLRLNYGSTADRGGYNLFTRTSSGSGSFLALPYIPNPNSAVSLGLSGTWRAVTNGGSGVSTAHQGHLWVRVS